jgi:hypothetical protein
VLFDEKSNAIQPAMNRAEVRAVIGATWYDQRRSRRSNAGFTIAVADRREF